ncbi:MAG: hypothetical protein ACRD8A_08830 [Candidatus Acidiferrales bacterium]
MNLSGRQLPGPTMLYGIPSSDRTRYQRVWRRLRRRDRSFAEHERKRDRAKHWRNRETYNAKTRAWKVKNRQRVSRYNRQYRRDTGHLCHFCGASGSSTKKLWPILRAVEEHGQLVERKVRVCWWCRHVAQQSPRAKGECGRWREDSAPTSAPRRQRCVTGPKRGKMGNAEYFQGGTNG